MQIHFKTSWNSLTGIAGVMDLRIGRVNIVIISGRRMLP